MMLELDKIHWRGHQTSKQALATWVFARSCRYDCSIYFVPFKQTLKLDQYSKHDCLTKRTLHLSRQLQFAIRVMMDIYLYRPTWYRSFHYWSITVSQKHNKVFTIFLFSEGKTRVMGLFCAGSKNRNNFNLRDISESCRMFIISLNI